MPWYARLMSDQRPRLLTVSQAAEYLQVTGDTIRRWLREGALKGTLLGDRAGWRISEQDIDEFLKRRNETGAP